MASKSTKAAKNVYDIHMMVSIGHQPARELHHNGSTDTNFDPPQLHLDNTFKEAKEQRNCNFLKKKKYLIIFTAVFLVIKTLDPDPDLLEMLDPYPDAQHWLYIPVPVCHGLNENGPVLLDCNAPGGGCGVVHGQHIVPVHPSQHKQTHEINILLNKWCTELFSRGGRFRKNTVPVLIIRQLSD